MSLGETKSPGAAAEASAAAVLKACTTKERTASTPTVICWCLAHISSNSPTTCARKSLRKTCNLPSASWRNFASEPNSTCSRAKDPTEELTWANFSSRPSSRCSPPLPPPSCSARRASTSWSPSALSSASVFQVRSRASLRPAKACLSSSSSSLAVAASAAASAAAAFASAAAAAAAAVAAAPSPQPLMPAAAVAFGKPWWAMLPHAPQRDCLGGQRGDPTQLLADVLGAARSEMLQSRSSSKECPGGRSVAPSEDAAADRGPRSPPKWQSRGAAEGAEDEERRAVSSQSTTARTSLLTKPKSASTTRELLADSVASWLA
mmetsp:Transcript_3557/g.13000  ORF Transcript_3557/g.13000 Transcript_3557/m.13000 type:complete len:320 (+) Transcript_3557:348-1307(+)